MKVTEFSLRNPIVIAALALALTAFGVSAYMSMGVGVTPNVSFPLVIVSTTDSGADPTTIETQVTKPIEDAVAGLANVDIITSTSSEGLSVVDVQFTTAANSELVPIDVERVVNAVRNKLPADADPPTITKIETSAFPVITVALSGPQSLDQVQRIATDRIERVFEAVPGVQSVAVGGGLTRELHVLVNLDKLQAYGLGLNSVQSALQNSQLEIPAGLLTANQKDVSVRLNALVTQPQQLGQIVLTTTAAGPVYLQDVASIQDSSKRVTEIDRVNGVPAVLLIATKLADGNALAVSQGIRDAMARLQPTLPQGMHMFVVDDAATYARQSFNTVRKTLLEAVFFTGLILLLFLHTWRSTMIVLVAIPTSLLTTFAVMNLQGQNLNLFSMLALTLSVGILVDDSIVVLENISRHIGMGRPPVVAAIIGRSEIGLAAITITMVDVVVYVPIALISGIAGDFIRPFAVVVASATLTSLAVSFTVTPLLASRFLTRSHALSAGAGPLAAFGRLWDAGFARVSTSYRSLLRVVLVGKAFRVIGMRWVTVFLGIVTFVLGILIFASGAIGVDIFPSGDQSEVDVSLTMAPATTLSATNTAITEMEQRLRQVKEVREVYVNIGGGGGGFGSAGGNIGRMTVLLVPISARSRSSSAIAQELRQILNLHIPGARLGVSLPNAFGFGGFGGQAIQVAVRGPDPNALNRLVDQITAAIKAVPGAVDVNNSNENVQPELVIHVDRRRAADLGVTAQAAGDALRTAVDGTVVAQYQQPGQNNIDIRLMTDSAFRAMPSNLGSLPIQSSNGTIVHLSQLGTIVAGTAPTQIAHYDRERSITINASASGIAPGNLQSAIQRRLNTLALPPGYTLTYSGQAAQGASAFNDIFRALGIAVLLMYVLMVMLFGSVTLPLAVLMSLPLAVIGALGAMLITHSSFTLFSLLGFALLLGLVGKNAILLVDFTDSLRKRGISRTKALLTAGPTRLRPIVMTTMSIFFGLAPVALGFEVGSELLRSAAIVLMGGLLTSTLLTLVFVPAMYTIFDDVQEGIVRLARRVAKPRELEPEEVAALRPPAALPSNGAVHQPVTAPLDSNG